MVYFSENLDTAQKRMASNKVPAWLRLKYEKEVMSFFIADDIEELEDLFLQKPLPLQELCDELCIRLKLDNTLSPPKSELVKKNYIADILRTSAWYQFYDFVEIVGDLLAEKDSLALNKIQEAINNYYEDEFLYDQIPELQIQLENYSFDVYREKVNFLFLSSWKKCMLGLDGRIQIINNSVDIDILRENHIATIKTNKKTGDPIRIDPKTPIEWLLERAGDSLIDESIRNSIQVSSDLFDEGNYLEALILLSTTIESILNKKIEKEGGKLQDLISLRPKVEFLEKRKKVPRNLFETVEIIKVRNLVLHGNFSPPKEFIEPLCILAFRCIKGLLIGFNDDNQSSLPT